MNLLLAISIILAIVIGNNSLVVMRAKKDASDYFAKGKYNEALMALSVKKSYKDKKMNDLYEKTFLLADLQNKIYRYQSFMKVKKYDFALNELIMAVGRTEDNKKLAKSLGVKKQYDNETDKFVSEAASRFSLTKKDVLRIYRSSNRAKYTDKLNEVLHKMKKK